MTFKMFEAWLAGYIGLSGSAITSEQERTIREKLRTVVDAPDWVTGDTE